jgi:hypothetical protein
MRRCRHLFPTGTHQLAHTLTSVILPESWTARGPTGKERRLIVRRRSAERAATPASSRSPSTRYVRPLAETAMAGSAVGNAALRSNNPLSGSKTSRRDSTVGETRCAQNVEFARRGRLRSRGSRGGNSRLAGPDRAES